MSKAKNKNEGPTMPVKKWAAGPIGCIVHVAGRLRRAQAYDYSAFRAHHPRSIVVLPPVNNSPDVAATYSVLSHATQPLAEGLLRLAWRWWMKPSRQNGLVNPAEMQSVSAAKLVEIFGADAALYITITQYGVGYTILDSAAIVAANARLVDLRSGQLLWKVGRARRAAKTATIRVAWRACWWPAVVKQVLNNLNDQSHTVAGVATQRMLAPGMHQWSAVRAALTPVWQEQQPRASQVAPHGHRTSSRRRLTIQSGAQGQQVLDDPAVHLAVHHARHHRQARGLRGIAGGRQRLTPQFDKLVVILTIDLGREICRSSMNRAAHDTASPEQIDLRRRSAQGTSTPQLLLPVPLGTGTQGLRQPLDQ